MRRPVTLAAVVAMAVGLGLVGCGDDATPPAAGPTLPTVTSTVKATKACEMITGADAATVLKINGAAKPAVDKKDECEYQSANGVDSVHLQVATEEYHAGAAQGVRDALDKEKTTELSGVGDAGFTFSLGPLGTVAYVWAKGRFLTITVTILSVTTDTKPVAESLARAAVARL